MTNNKNLKLTLTALFGGVAALTAGVSAMTLTSCKPADTTVVLKSTAEATKYLADHSKVLNTGTTDVTQATNWSDAANVAFKNLLNTKLDIQNLANSIVQYYAPKLVNATGASNELSVKVEGNSLWATYQNKVTDAETTTTTTVYELTLTKGSLNAELLTPCKLSGKVSTQVNEQTPTVSFESANGVELTGAGTYSTGAGAVLPGAGTWNVVKFGTGEGAEHLYLALTGVVSEGVSTGDTAKLVFATGV